MAKRKPISKKLRFEVFKRDSFTCQYCGRMAPDVVLEVDHIHPVAEGGTDSIVNLITSCRDCNRGKGKTLLKDNDSVKKSQEELKELNERREQIEMMLEWKRELSSFDDEQVNHIQDFFESVTGVLFSDHGRAEIKKLLKKYSFEEVYSATEAALDSYYAVDDGTPEKAFNYIGRICYTRKCQKKNPNLKDINYLAKIASNRLHYMNRGVFMQIVKPNYKQEDFEDIKAICSDSKNWTVLRDRLQLYYFGGEE